MSPSGDKQQSGRHPPLGKDELGDDRPIEGGMRLVANAKVVRGIVAIVRLVPSRTVVYLRRMSGGSPPRKTETTGTWLEALRKGLSAA